MIKIKAKAKISPAMMMVVHQVMTKIKLMKMSKLKKLSKLNLIVKTGTQMIKLIK